LHNESNQPFRGFKRDLYEGGIRVPFIARWKRTLAEGKVSEHVSAFWDFFPTACELAGAKTPEGIDGISYLPELLGKPQKKHDYLYFEFHEEGGKQAILQGDLKCIKLIVKNPKLTKIELYDMKTDPKESHNLASKYPDKIDEFQVLFKQARTESANFKLY
jgi:arylsulfatase A-like enzyme